MHLLTEEFSMDQAIRVYDTSRLYGKTGNYRFLQFSNDAVQGAIDLNDPKRIVLEYPKAIIHLMEYNNPLFEKVFVIGHGIGTIAGHYPDKQFKVAEIDAKVAELSKRFFGYSKDNIIIGDGREILRNEQPGSFDYIILDAFTQKGTPQHLTTAEFFKLTADKLNSRGAIILNLTGKAANDKLVDAVHTTLGQSYGNIQAFSLPGEHAAEIRNIIVIGSHKPTGFEARKMAGFYGIRLGQGHIIKDKEPDMFN